MDTESLLLFAHVAGAMGLFAALGMEGMCLVALSRATHADEVGPALRGQRSVARVGGASAGILVLSGFYLAATVWQWRGAWIALGFGGLLLVAGLGGFVTARTIRRLTPTGGIDPNRWHGRARGGDIAILQASFAARAVILIGVLFLMTVKPESSSAVFAALITLAVAATIGLATLRQNRRPALP